MASAKFTIGGRIVNRIAAHDEQQINLARIHVADQLFQRGRLILRLGLNRIGIDHGVAGRPQRLIHRMRQSVHGRRLIVAGNHDRRALVRLKIFHHRRNELLMLRLRPAAAPPPAPNPAAMARASGSISDARTGRR